MHLRNLPGAAPARGHAAGTPPPRDGKRLLQGNAGTYDAEAHTVEVVISTGAAVRRWYGVETLAITAEAVDLSRVVLGQVKLLDSHNAYDSDAVLGSVISARIENGQLIGIVKFHATDKAREKEARVSREELTGISCRYEVNTWRVVEINNDTGVETWSADRWQLLEVSLVSVPADPTAGIRSAAFAPGTPAAESGLEEENTDMPMRNQPGANPAPATAVAAAAAASATLAASPAPETRANPAAPPIDEAAIRRAAVEGERARHAAIDTAIRTAGLPDEDRRAAIDSSVTAEHIGNWCLERMAARGTQRPSGARIIQDNTAPDLVMERMAIAIAARGTAHLPQAQRIAMRDDAREYAGVGLLGMFADIARARGHRVPHNMQRAQLFDHLVQMRALSTSDFPLLLASAANKVLLPAFNLATPTFFRIAARETFNDFKAHHFLRIGDFPNLLEKGELGEIKEGSISESDQTVTAVEYARIVHVSRRVLINDDLSAFTRLPAMAGQRAAQVANTLGFNLFALNTNAGPTITEAGTGTAMWEATTHVNYTSSGTAIDVSSLGVGRAAMMKQTSLDSMKLNIMPRYLLTSIDKFTLAQQYTLQINPQVVDAAKVNPFGGALEPITDANLTMNSSLSWFLFADPSVAPVFVYGYLAGQEGPRMDTAEDFNTEGIKLRCAMDYGCGGIDFRGTYKNAGA